MACGSDRSATRRGNPVTPRLLRGTMNALQHLSTTGWCPPPYRHRAIGREGRILAIIVLTLIFSSHFRVSHGVRLVHWWDRWCGTGGWLCKEEKRPYLFSSQQVVSKDNTHFLPAAPATPTPLTLPMMNAMYLCYHSGLACGF